MEREGGGEDDIVCLDESFFINDNYQLTKFTFGSQVLELFCLHAASTDFDLTGQLVWPGAMLLNDYLSKNAEMLQGCSVIELGSGVGVTGILCSRFCREVVLTDHNEEVLKILNKNIELHTSSENRNCTGLVAKKLEWGSSAQIKQILDEHSGGFDLVLGADIYILINTSILKFSTELFYIYIYVHYVCVNYYYAICHSARKRFIRAWNYIMLRCMEIKNYIIGLAGGMPVLSPMLIYGRLKFCL
ncbi:hypothetical protein PVL29_007935 [Vitis rotundifolia]|uniref:Methyltransferase family protein n=1 Tax=Vitis rotundifolia TaxID=103349 RepID=A0AA39A184_VITRO|nr:hypothetical protein PVL29_007935 [Vitis rotundifolia]